MSAVVGLLCEKCQTKYVADWANVNTGGPHICDSCSVERVNICAHCNRPEPKFWPRTEGPMSVVSEGRYYTKGSNVYWCCSRACEMAHKGIRDATN